MWFEPYEGYEGKVIKSFAKKWDNHSKYYVFEFTDGTEIIIHGGSSEYENCDPWAEDGNGIEVDDA